MPELPEVQTTVFGLNKKVLNRTFIDVWTDAKKLFKNISFLKFKKEIKGKKIKKIYRLGKNIIFELSGGYFMLVHQKMTGHLLYDKWQEDKMNSFIHVKFYLDNNKILALSDLRKFAKIELHKTRSLILNLGPDPLEKEFTFSRFKRVLKKGKIKQVLMNQEVIAGIGNIYSDEILWQAKIHPEKDALKLSDKELKRIYGAMKIILKKGVKLGGTSISDYRNIEGKKGKFGNVRKVYRKEGQKCPRCGSVIVRKKMGGRSAHFCPHCQTL
jgi:formamidopyrimidine-DNA glycosylase